MFPKSVLRLSNLVRLILNEKFGAMDRVDEFSGHLLFAKLFDKRFLLECSGVEKAKVIVWDDALTSGRGRITKLLQSDGSFDVFDGRLYSKSFRLVVVVCVIRADVELRDWQGRKDYLMSQFSGAPVVLVDCSGWQRRVGCSSQ